MDDRTEDRNYFDQWVGGDVAGFSALYEKYKNRMFAFLFRMTSDRSLAEDLMQETFLAALRNSKQYDRNRSFLSWIFGIGHKRTIDYYRHAKVEREHQGDTEKSVGSRMRTQENFVKDSRIRDMINEAIGKLDPVQREVFLLRELGDMPFKDIAELMNCPINTALGRMRLALRNIRKDLEKRGVHGVH